MKYLNMLVMVVGMCLNALRARASVVAAMALALFGGLAQSARAEGPDLTAVTGGLTSTGTAVIAVAAAVVTSAMGLFAIKFGGRWILKLWKSFTG